MIASHVIATTSAAAALSIPSSSLPRTGILHLIFSTGASARPRLICPGYRLWYLACPPWGTLGAIILRFLRRSPLVCERERHTAFACSSSYCTIGLVWILMHPFPLSVLALHSLRRRCAISVVVTFLPITKRSMCPAYFSRQKRHVQPPHSFCYR